MKIIINKYDNGYSIICDDQVPASPQEPEKMIDRRRKWVLEGNRDQLIEKLKELL